MDQDMRRTLSGTPHSTESDVASSNTQATGFPSKQTPISLANGEHRSDSRQSRRSSEANLSEDEALYYLRRESYEDKWMKSSTFCPGDFLPDDTQDGEGSSDAVIIAIQRGTQAVYAACLLLSFAASIIIYQRFVFRTNHCFWLITYTAAWMLWAFLMQLRRQIPLKQKLADGKAATLATIAAQAVGLMLRVFFSSTFRSSTEGLLGEHPFLLCGVAVSLCFFLLLESILEAYWKESNRKQALLEEERRAAQKSLDRAINGVAEEKGQYLRTVSKQLQQKNELAIKILKQVAPPRFLSTPHEQATPCAISVPTAQITAIYTSLKAVNYISTHLGTLSRMLIRDAEAMSGEEPAPMKREYDIGEMIQRVCDVLAGIAATARVEFVLYHADYGFYHQNIHGNEDAFCHALLDILKSLLGVSHPGDTVEVGLQIQGPDTDSQTEKRRRIRRNDELTCRVEVTHTRTTSSPRLGPMMANIDLSRKILSSLGADFTVDEDKNNDKQRFEIVLNSMAGTPLAKQNVPIELIKRFPHSRAFGEPSIDELQRFSHDLRGLKVALHATTKSSFAKHLTSCLAAWRMDIVHIPIDEEKDAKPAQGSKSNGKGTSTPGADVPYPEDTRPMFIMIDDNIEILRQQLIDIRDTPFKGSAGAVMNPKPGRKKRNVSLPTLPLQTTAVIHFTSITKYKAVKDSVQFLMMQSVEFQLPQVLVIPKPAGPRRILTTLHTAGNKIVVDPAYVPIATSPSSPGLHAEGEADQQVSESPDTYFAPNLNGFPPRFSSPTAANGLARSSIPSLSPSSPKTGPGGGLLVVPKNGKSKSPNEDQQKSRDTPLGPGSDSSVKPQAATPPPRPGSPPGGSAREPASSVRPMSPPPRSPPVANQRSTTPAPKYARRLGSGKTTTEHVIPPIKVLIVEDNPINQAILNTFMKRRNIKCECASNGQEAVDKWKKGGFHLILMDIQLPVMDGITATKEIRRLEQEKNIVSFGSASSTSSTPSASNSLSPTPMNTPLSITPPNTPSAASPVIIVALTASSLQSDRQNALAAGCNDFLTKPVKTGWLEKKIQEWGCMQALIDYGAISRPRKDGQPQPVRTPASTPPPTSAIQSMALNDASKEPTVLKRPLTQLHLKLPLPDPQLRSRSQPPSPQWRSQWDAQLQTLTPGSRPSAMPQLQLQTTTLPHTTSLSQPSSPRTPIAVEPRATIREGTGADADADADDLRLPELATVQPNSNGAGATSSFLTDTVLPRKNSTRKRGNTVSEGIGGNGNLGIVDSNANANSNVDAMIQKLTDDRQANALTQRTLSQ